MYVFIYIVYVIVYESCIVMSNVCMCAVMCALLLGLCRGGKVFLYPFGVPGWDWKLN